MKKKIFYEKKLERIKDTIHKIGARIDIEKAHLAKIDKDIKELIGQSFSLSIGKKSIANESAEKKTALAVRIQDLLIDKRSAEKRIAHLEQVKARIGVGRIYELMDDAKWNRDRQIAAHKAYLNKLPSW